MAMSGPLPDTKPNCNESNLFQEHCSQIYISNISDKVFETRIGRQFFGSLVSIPGLLFGISTRVPCLNNVGTIPNFNTNIKNTIQSMINGFTR